MLPPTVPELKRELFELSECERAELLPAALKAQLSLDFQALPLLKPVTRQFEYYGIQFGSACANGVSPEVIALSPSNKRFTQYPGQVVLMPLGNVHSLVIRLSSLTNRICLWGRGTDPIQLQTWGSEGNPLSAHQGTCSKLPNLTRSAVLNLRPNLLPRQVFKLDVTAVAKMTVSSNAPFIIEGIRL